MSYVPLGVPPIQWVVAVLATARDNPTGPNPAVYEEARQILQEFLNGL